MFRNRICKFVFLAGVAAGVGCAQSINSSTVTGTVTDPTGAVVANARVELRKAVTGYAQSQQSDSAGAFRFNNVPPNSYHVTATAKGFSIAQRDIEVRSALPICIDISLALGSGSTTINVEAAGGLVESDPSAHQDVDRNTFLQLPTFDPGGQLRQMITYSSGAVAADANGFYHPLGDHAQTTIVIDGQPISDQQSKLFSTQIPTNALQSMEIISGTPDAQYGDKTSLIVNATTRSGLGATKAFGIECPYIAHRESICAPRSSELLSQSQSIRRYTRHRIATPVSYQLRYESGCFVHVW